MPVTEVSPLERIRDGMYPYKGFHDCDCICHLRVYRTPGAAEPSRADPLVVIATELEENHGTSITNACGELAQRVREEYGLAADELIWVERYPERGPRTDRIEEEFSVVAFQLDGQGRYAHPEWKWMPKTKIEALVGDNLDDLPQDPVDEPKRVRRGTKDAA